MTVPNPISWPLRLSLAREKLKKLIAQITKIEQDQTTPDNEKLSEIKKIRDEIKDVAGEIDRVKKEIKLLSTYNVN